jgi:DNA-binding LacI/PurR family transcriptional regulator
MKKRVDSGENPDGRVTLADIATRSGFSKATVSYALNGREGVSERARTEILELAKSLGYVRRGPRRDFDSRQDRKIGVVISRTEPDGSLNYYITSLLAGFEEHCRQAGIALEVATWEGWSTYGSIRDGAISGFAYLGGSFTTDILAGAPEPSVLIGTDCPGWAYDTVLADNRRGAYLATKHLLEQGRLRLGMINGPRTTRTSESKWAGFQDALAEFATASEVGTEVGEFSFESGYEAVKRFFTGKRESPNGLFVADDPMALGACRALSDLGIAVPQEVAVVGFGNSPAGAIARPTISTVEVFKSHLGSIGASLLLDRLDGVPAPHQLILVAPSLVVRESSAVPGEETGNLRSIRQGEKGIDLVNAAASRVISPLESAGQDD